MTNQQQFLGYTFDTLEMDDVITRIVTWSLQERFRYVVTPNVDHVVARYNAPPEASMIDDAYDMADLTLCDSRVLARLAHASGLDLPVVPGSDLTAHLVALAESGTRIAVIGGGDHLYSELTARYPSLDWNFHKAPMGLRTDRRARAAVCEFVEHANCALTFFAVGAPQSELCCAQIARSGQASGVALCVGASLEFLTGVKTRAPNWMQRWSLEWLHRLVSEPGRLWRRYLLDGPRIFVIWWRARKQGDSG